VADADNLLDRVKDELGEPSAAYEVGQGRYLAKLSVGLALFLGGAGLIVAVFGFGLGNFAGFFHKFLILLPVSGVLVLWHLYKTRGLHVLLYTTGLLRFQRGEVESFPWGEIETIRLKSDQGSVEVLRDETGAAAECWVAVEAPHVQFWKAGLTVARADGVTAKLTPAVAGYADLVERVQRATFTGLRAKASAEYRSLGAVIFGPFQVTWGGLLAAAKLLPWGDLAEIAIAGRSLVVKRKGKWLAWATHELEQVPNPHVFLALVDEARRSAVPVARPAADAAATGEERP
jgi:hypothetical protein